MWCCSLLLRCFLWVPEGFFSLNHDWFACQLQRAEFLRKGSHEGPLFQVFPLSLQSIISNQMWPRRLRGALFSRLLLHPTRRQSRSILSPGTHMGWPWQLVKTSFSATSCEGTRYPTGSGKNCAGMPCTGSHCAETQRAGTGPAHTDANLSSNRHLVFLVHPDYGSIDTGC